MPNGFMQIGVGGDIKLFVVIYFLFMLKQQYAESVMRIFLGIIAALIILANNSPYAADFPGEGMQDISNRARVGFFNITDNVLRIIILLDNETMSEFDHDSMYSSGILYLVNNASGWQGFISYTTDMIKFSGVSISRCTLSSVSALTCEIISNKMARLYNKNKIYYSGQYIVNLTEFQLINTPSFKDLEEQAIRTKLTRRNKYVPLDDSLSLERKKKVIDEMYSEKSIKSLIEEYRSLMSIVNFTSSWVGNE